MVGKSLEEEEEDGKSCSPQGYRESGGLDEEDSGWEMSKVVPCSRNF